MTSGEISSCVIFAIAVASLCSLAAGSGGEGSSSKGYALWRDFTANGGQDFFSYFNFITDDDPTHGYGKFLTTIT